MWLRLAPWAFIFIWSCGYGVSKYIIPYAPPLTFLSLRFAGCIVLMACLAVWAGKSIPRGRLLWHTVVAGAFMHFGYLAGCWVAIAQGLPSGEAALIVNLQPILTAVLGLWMGEQVTKRQWLGLVLGFLGVAVVLAAKASPSTAQVQHWAVLGIVCAVAALVAMTVGTLYQKKFCAGVDPRAGQIVQFAASLVLCAPLAWCLEDQPVLWTSQLWGALAFSILVLSGMGTTLFLWLIGQGQALRVTGYMYCVPPISGLIGWWLFDERLAPMAWLGFALVAAGVYAVVRVPTSKTSLAS